MTDRLHRALVLGLLDNLPPSLEQAVISSREFQTRYQVAMEAKLSLDRGLSFKRSIFFNAVRALYENPDSRSKLASEEGDVCFASLEGNADARHVILTTENRKLRLPALWFLSSHIGDRLGGFDAEAKKRHLIDPVILEWRERLAKSALEDDEVDELHQEIRLTPGGVAEAIAGELSIGEGKIETFVPKKTTYYDRLVGPLKGSPDLVSFVDRTMKERLKDLLDWNFADGFRLALLACPQNSLSGAIDIDRVPESQVSGEFEWLYTHGDRFSQVAGIELGLRLLHRFPKIEPILQGMVACLVKDDPDDPEGRLALSASVTIFVDGELARLGILRNAPPYYRRLAALAQASLIERELISADVEISSFGDWARRGRVQNFFLQSLIDLRTEPRWLPDFMSSHQLKCEFLGRISYAGIANSKAIQSQEFRELLMGEGPGSVKSELTFPSAFLPGPLEAGHTPLQAPKEFESFLNMLKAGEINEPALAPFVNMALIFKFEKEHAETIAIALREAKYQVAIQADSDRIFSLLVGLAMIASVTKSAVLADEVRILARVMRRRPGVILKADSLMRIGMIAAAADIDAVQWACRVGDWFTEVSLEDMDRNTAVAMRSHVRHLCGLEPRLWKACAKADAAFSLVIGMAA